MIEQSVMALKYPDKIIILTRNQRDEFVWYITLSFSELRIDVSDEELGLVVFNHLAQSKRKDIEQHSIQESWKQFLKISKIKTEKNFFKDARCVNIIVNDNKTLFEPKKNKLNKNVFYGMPEQVSVIANTSSEKSLGFELKKNWEKCVFAE